MLQTLRNFFKKKEPEITVMAPRKKVVEVTKLDGYEPVKDDGVLKLRAPYEISVGAGGLTTVALGIKFNVPVLLLPWVGTQAQGLALTNAGTVVLPGNEPILYFEASQQEGALFELKDTLALAVPLNGDYDVKVV